MKRLNYLRSISGAVFKRAMSACFRVSAALIAAATLAFPGYANDGAYDPSFGSGGQTWINAAPTTFDFANKLIRLPNGNFLMAGGCSNDGFVNEGETCTVWLTPAGQPAAGYGPSGNGTAVFDAFVGWVAGKNSALDTAAFPDSRVVLVGQDIPGSGSYMALLRANGSGLDPSVGNGAGYVPVPFKVRRVRVTPQQQVVVVGYTETSPYAIVVARYDSSFHLDTSFGSSGLATLGFADGSAVPTGMTLQRDGKIVAIGGVGSSPPALGIVRLTINGAPDPAFGISSDGRFESTLGSTFGATGLDIVEDKQGRLVFAGLAYTDNTSGGEWLVDRVLAGGATDASFNGGQPHKFTIFGSSTAYQPYACCIALQSDGRIVVAGLTDRPPYSYNYYFAMARFLDNGAFDSTWGNGGQSYGDMSTQAPNVSTDTPTSMVIVPGGVVLGGSSVANSEERFVATKMQIDLLFADDFQ